MYVFPTRAFLVAFSHQGTAALLWRESQELTVSLLVCVSVLLWRKATQLSPDIRPTLQVSMLLRTTIRRNKYTLFSVLTTICSSCSADALIFRPLFSLSSFRSIGSLISSVRLPMHQFQINIDETRIRYLWCRHRMPADKSHWDPEWCLMLIVLNILSKIRLPLKLSNNKSPILIYQAIHQ
jgi:hypothetical protein